MDTYHEAQLIRLVFLFTIAVLVPMLWFALWIGFSGLKRLVRSLGNPRQSQWHIS
jgi:hypothetical protein